MKQQTFEDWAAHVPPDQVLAAAAEARQRFEGRLPELPSFGACPESEDALDLDETRCTPTSGRLISASPIPRPDPDEGCAASPLPADSDERKRTPLCSGLFDYFPAALAAVARHSYESNEKHNPGEPMYWARGKSMDHRDCLLRHLMDARAAEAAQVGSTGDIFEHYTALAWRALAILQETLEDYGAPIPPNAREQ